MATTQVVEKKTRGEVMSGRVSKSTTTECGDCHGRICEQCATSPANVPSRTTKKPILTTKDCGKCHATKAQDSIICRQCNDASKVGKEENAPCYVS